MIFFKKVAVAAICSLLLFPISSNQSYSLTTDSLTITFKQGTDEKYIKLINVFTDTEIKNKISDNTYVFSILKNPENPDINNYSYLLSMIPEVESITPQISTSLKNKKSGEYVDGIILVRYKDGTTSKDISKIDSTYKTQSVLFSKTLNLYKVKLPSSLSVEQAVKTLSKLSQVKYAEPDRIMKIQNKNMGLHISFKDNQNLSPKIFENIYSLKTTKVTNSDYYLINISDKYNSDEAIKAFKLSPYVMDVKQVK